MADPRHSWGGKSRPDEHQTIQTCIKCGVQKIVRHEGDKHWMRFWRDGYRVDAERTPPCVRGARR